MNLSERLRLERQMKYVLPNNRLFGTDQNEFSAVVYDLRKAGYDRCKLTNEICNRRAFYW